MGSTPDANAAAAAAGVPVAGAGAAEGKRAGELYAAVDVRGWAAAVRAAAGGARPRRPIAGRRRGRVQSRGGEGGPRPAEARHCTPSGCAVEARLYAEDPAAGYLPQTGVLRRFEIDPAPGLRLEAGVASGTVVGSDYDPMLAKVIAHAGTRTEAIRRLAAALE